MQNNIFSCEYCDFTTKRKYNLQRHQTVLHISNNSNFDNEKKDIQNEKKISKMKKKISKMKKKISKMKFNQLMSI